MSRLFSPYDLNPRGFNPLTAIRDERIDVRSTADLDVLLAEC